MSDGFPNEGRYAQRIGEDGDRWRCSLCDGYVRGNAPLCKHCHARFGAPEPLPADEADNAAKATEASEPDEPATLWQKVAIGFILAFTVVICIGCYMLAIRIGDSPGIITGWLLAPALVTLVFFVIPPSFGEPFEGGVWKTLTSFLSVWFVLTLLVLPIMAFYLVDFNLAPWWGRPLAVATTATLFPVIAKVITSLPWFRSANQDDTKTETFDFLGSWRKSMLTFVLPYSVLIFIGERLNFEIVYIVGLVLLLNTRLRRWLWQQCKALWQRVRSGTPE